MTRLHDSGKGDFIVFNRLAPFVIITQFISGPDAIETVVGGNSDFNPVNSHRVNSPMLGSVVAPLSSRYKALGSIYWRENHKETNKKVSALL